MATGVPAMISTALAAISNEMDIDSTDSADEFQLSERGLYQNTIRNFTRRISGDSNRRPRGRPSSTVRLNFFLLAEPTPLLPSLEEQRRLTSMGLGTPKEAVPVRRNLSLLEFQQLIHSLYTGLEIGGVLDVLQQHKEDANVLFHRGTAALTMDRVESFLQFHYESLEEGSNNHRIAQAMEQGIVFLLQAAESGEASFHFHRRMWISLNDILMWMTGASNVPAIGFPKNIDIYFDAEAVLPKVNTCSLEVHLPLLSELNSTHHIMRKMAEWILDSQGFGQV